MRFRGATSIFYDVLALPGIDPLPDPQSQILRAIGPAVNSHSFNWIVVESSAIRALAYHTDASLGVAFASGARYRYRDVPEDVFRAFLAAPSKGRYFNDEIRDRFPFTYDVE